MGVGRRGARGDRGGKGRAGMQGGEWAVGKGLSCLDRTPAIYMDNRLGKILEVFTTTCPLLQDVPSGNLFRILK